MKRATKETMGGCLVLLAIPALVLIVVWGIVQTAHSLAVYEADGGR